MLLKCALWRPGLLQGANFTKGRYNRERVCGCVIKKDSSPPVSYWVEFEGGEGLSSDRGEEIKGDIIGLRVFSTDYAAQRLPGQALSS